MEITRDILIVDDDKQVREVLHQIFLTAGYNCRLASDGREGGRLPGLLAESFEHGVR